MKLDRIDWCCVGLASVLLLVAWGERGRGAVLRNVVAGREVLRLVLTNGSVVVNPTWPGLARVDTVYGSYFVGLRSEAVLVTNRVGR